MTIDEMMVKFNNVEFLLRQIRDLSTEVIDKRLRSLEPSAYYERLQEMEEALDSITDLIQGRDK